MMGLVVKKSPDKKEITFRPTVVKQEEKAKKPSETIKETVKDNEKPCEIIEETVKHNNLDPQNKLVQIFYRSLRIKYEPKNFIKIKETRQYYYYAEKEVEEEVKGYLSSNKDVPEDKIWKITMGGNIYFLKYPNEKVKILALLNNCFFRFFNDYLFDYDEDKESMCFKLTDMEINKLVFNKDNFNKFFSENNFKINTKLKLNIDDIYKIKSFKIYLSDEKNKKFDDLKNYEKRTSLKIDGKTVEGDFLIKIDEIKFLPNMLA